MLLKKVPILFSRSVSFYGGGFSHKKAITLKRDGISFKFLIHIVVEDFVL